MPCRRSTLDTIDMRSKLEVIELLMLAKIVVTPRSLRAYYNFRSVLLVVTPQWRQARCRFGSVSPSLDSLPVAPTTPSRTLLRIQIY